MPQIVDTYEVKPGDSLSAIASRFGLTLRDLLQANQQIQNPNVIQIGQKINIPSTEPAPPPTPGPGQTETYDGIHPAPGTITTNRADYNHPPLTNLAGQRDPAIYSQLINQFAVGFNPRYLPGHGNTYCNIFAWDVSRAMGAELPHWVDSSGNIAVPFAPNANEININGGVNWINDHGVPQLGWQRSNPQQAQDAANQGQVAVVMWKNPTGGHGHVAVIRPGSINDGGPETAQAGRHNFNDGHVVNGFGNLSPLQYFSHD